MVGMLGEEVKLKMRASVDAINKQHIEAGMTITAAPPDDVAAMQAAMIPVWNKWADDTGDEAKYVLADLKELLGR